MSLLHSCFYSSSWTSIWFFYLEKNIETSGYLPQITWRKKNIDELVTWWVSKQFLIKFVPKPSKSNSYCCICKTAFDDYLTHINMPSHCSNSQASTFVNDIIALTSQFNAKADPLLSKKLYGKSRKIKKCVRKGKKNCTINGYLSSTTICN